LVILGASFRLLARLLLPLALLSILAACGGSGKQTRPGRLVRGPGFSFAVPTGWAVRRTDLSTGARRGTSIVSVTVLALRKPYAPALFDRATRELDRVAAKLAGASHGTLTESVTTSVAGEPARAYRYATSSYEARIGFVLRGRREYELFCRNAKGAGDADGACALLFSSFTVP
jgi:hypothetical protein